MPSAKDLKDLEKELASAEKKLKVQHGVDSGSSEERDVVQEGQRVQEELEWKSNASSVSSAGPARPNRSEDGGSSGRQQDPSRSDKSDKSSGVGDAEGGSGGRAYRGMPGRLQSRPASSGAAALDMGVQQVGRPQSAGERKESQQVATPKMGAAGRRDGQPGSGSQSSSAVGSGAGNSGVRGEGSGAGNSGSGVGNSGGGSGVTSTSDTATLASRSTNRSAGHHLVTASGAGTMSGSSGSKTGDQLPKSAQDIVDGLVADVESQGVELIKLKDKLALSVKAEGLAEEDKATLIKQLKLSKKRNAASDTVAEILTMTQERLSGAQDERDDLKDKMMGQDAKHNAQRDRMQQDVSELQDKLRMQEEDSSTARVETEAGRSLEQAEGSDRRKILAEEMVQMQHTIMKAEQDRIRQAGEMSAASAMKTLQIEALEGQLSASKREIGRKDELLSDQDIDVPQNNKDRQVLEELLGERRTSEKRMARELAEMRVHMLESQQEKDAEITRLSKVLDIERSEKNLRLTPPSASSADGAGSLGIPRGKGRAAARGTGKGVGGKGLASIDEEGDEDIGSQAGSSTSGQVSSDGSEGANNVADLKDFDDASRNRLLAMTMSMEKHSLLNPEDVAVAMTIAALGKNIDYVDPALARKLREEVLEAQLVNQQLKDQEAAKDAEYWSKRERLFYQLQGLRAEATANELRMAELKQASDTMEADKDAVIAQAWAKLESLKEELEHEKTEAADNTALRDQKQAFIFETAQLQQQLTFAIEAKRLAIARLDDTRRELEASEHRHARVVSDFQARLQLVTTGNADPGQEDLMERLRNVEEERNVLRNELECERLQWQDQLEREQREHAVNLKKLRDNEQMLLKERDLGQKMQESMDLMHVQLESAVKAREEADRARETAAFNASRDQASVGLVLPTWMRCPSRAAKAPLPSSASSSASGGGSDNRNSLQEIIWQVLSAIRGVTALLCSSDSLKILDASKKAFSLWGSAALRGSSLFSLIFDQATASWLKMEITTTITPAFAAPGTCPGFWLRELGCVEFRSRLGSALDSQVICVRLPEEPRLARPSAMLVIVEPMQEEARQEKQEMRGNSQQHFFARAAYQHTTSSRAPSVTSEDITANDSVSNVNVGY